MGRLLVVLCPERSGSTLLSMVLGANPRIVAPPELHLFRYPDHEAWRAGYPKAVESLRWLLSRTLPDLTPDDFAGHTPAETCERVLAAIPEDDWLVDKTPAYARSSEILDRIEATTPHYLWLIRHPLGVVASRMDVWQRRRRTGLGDAVKDRSPGAIARAGAGIARAALRRRFGGEIQRKLDYWTDLHARIDAFLGGIPADRQRTVHFERLVHDPSAALDPLCDWLGVDFDPRMLDPRAALPTGLAAGIGDEKIRQTKGIDPAVADRWREALDPNLVDPATRALMDRLGLSG